MIQSIGIEFSSNMIATDLLPGIKLPIGQYTIDVTSVSVDKKGNTVHNMTSWHAYSTDGIFAYIGHDILYISVNIFSQNHHFAQNLSSLGQYKYHYSIRVDKLILMNIVVKLLKKDR